MALLNSFFSNYLVVGGDEIKKLTILDDNAGGISRKQCTTYSRPHCEDLPQRNKACRQSGLSRWESSPPTPASKKNGKQQSQGFDDSKDIRSTMSPRRPFRRTSNDITLSPEKLCSDTLLLDRWSECGAEAAVREMPTIPVDFLDDSSTVCA